jgi:glucose-1-phosphate cytidylyltransferase
MTYGDGVANIDLAAELRFHREHGRLATLAAVRPAKRFGVLGLEGDKVVSFAEKPDDEGGWINGGFFLLSPRVGDFIAGDDTIWEQDPLKTLVGKDQLRAYQHHGFWHPMDTLRDKTYLEQLWASGRPEWITW